MRVYSDFTSYRQAWDNADIIDPTVPLNIDIELASTCNLRCPSCFIPDPEFEKFISQPSEDGRPLRRLMPKEMAFKIIDQCAEIGVPALKFNWRGESTLHPDYSEIIQYARLKKEIYLTPASIVDPLSLSTNTRPMFFELLANTNANCTDKAIDGLMATTKCMVSLDSMNPRTYKIMRTGGRLERAKEVINELVKRKHSNLWIRRVLTKLNKDEPFHEQVGFEWGDAVKCSSHYCFDRNATEVHEVSGCDHDTEMPRKYCQYPSQRLIITSRGLAYPCCLDLHETMHVGDVNKQTILEIWNGDPLKKLRAALRTNRTDQMTPTCQFCESWMAYDKPQRDFVQDREEKIEEVIHE